MNDWLNPWSLRLNPWSLPWQALQRRLAAEPRAANASDAWLARAQAPRERVAMRTDRVVTGNL